MADLDQTLSALAHPVRHQVLARQRNRDALVKDLALSRRISGPAITRHLHMLEHAGLIIRGRDAQQRPCRLRVAPLKDFETAPVHTQVKHRAVPGNEDNLDRLQPSSAKNLPKKKPIRGANDEYGRLYKIPTGADARNAIRAH